MSQFGFRTSPNSQSAVSSAQSQSPQPTSSLSMAVTGAGTPSSAISSAAANSSPTGAAPGQQRCCDTGRPLFTDPITGQTVCSCQYDLLGYQRLAGGVPGLPALSMYSAPYPEGMAAYFPALGADQAPFYTTTAAGLELKENLAAGAASWPYPSVYHPYDTAFAGYPFNGYGMDLNGARRKNATRETTSTLKAWLNEHKKNPYPTKGEKIMLAIITKMTLTQVSTWFANARRRLKKENKMTWEPRNRVEDEDNNNDDDDHKSTDGKDLIDSKDSGTGSSEDGDRPPHPRLAPDTGSEWSESRPDSGPDSPELLYERGPHPQHGLPHPHHPAFLPQQRVASTSPPPTGSGPTATPGTVAGGGKPRIWSLADMASKEGDTVNTPPVSSAFYSAGRLMPRLPPPGLHNSPYSRPHEFYRSLYAPGSSGNVPSDVALLESYSRTFGAGLNAATTTAMMSKGIVASSSSTSPCLPLGLTTTSNARVSPSSTSSVSSGSEGPLSAPHGTNNSNNNSATSKPMALNKA